MFIYTITNMFGQAVVSAIHRFPNGTVSVVTTTDVTKALHYEEVDRLLTAGEKRAHNLELSWLNI